jgi:hypothetical protein
VGRGIGNRLPKSSEGGSVEEGVSSLVSAGVDGTAMDILEIVNGASVEERMGHDFWSLLWMVFICESRWNSSSNSGAWMSSLFTQESCAGE